LQRSSLCINEGPSVSNPAVEDHPIRSKPAKPAVNFEIGMRVVRTAVRVGILSVGHVAVLACVFLSAFALRFDMAIPAVWVYAALLNLTWVLSLKLALFYITGQLHGWWRYVTMADLAALLKATTLSLIAMVVIDRFLVGSQIPRSIFFLDYVLSIVCLGALRASWRLVRELKRVSLGHEGSRSVLLVGSGHSAGLLANQMQSLPHSPFRILGLLDADRVKVGTRLGQVRILGTLEDVETVARAQGVCDVFVIAGSLPGKRLRSLIAACSRSGLTLKIIPAPEELFRGSERIPTRDIEINDLLRRDPVELDSESIGKLLKGKTVLVTGAGGSIGSEICRQVLKFGPRTLVLVGKGENRIFHIDGELQGLASATRVISRIADVTDARRMRQLFHEFRPQVVFHAAAHKHVPLMEANVGEAVKNNVGGTKCVADLANDFSAECFVLISSDKAVNPANVMGATKNLAERYVIALAETSSTRFIVTRFGNVLGSAGSVVPIFQEQIRRGGPITVTDSRMTRYFMTIPEASQLVLQAAAIGRGHEVFVLDMGEPVKIVDLARDMIRLSGLPENSIEIVYSGMRSGEKLYEEMFFDEEETLPTSHEKIRVAYHRPEDLTEVRGDIHELTELVHGPRDQILARLRECVPEYQPHSEEVHEAKTRQHKSFELAEVGPRGPHILP
jgi:FlaA1/EpsC-like NDP-sugar epimerase